jgi:hypothetical protein
MTIRVEREALLTVINTSQSSTRNPSSTKRATTSLSSKPCHPCIRDEDEFVIVDSVPTKEFYSDLIPGSTGDDDLASLCTLSTSSESSCDVSTVERRVTFATQIVTDVWRREKTLPEDVSNLYYSSAETQTVCIFRSHGFSTLIWYIFYVVLSECTSEVYFFLYLCLTLFATHFFLCAIIRLF